MPKILVIGDIHNKLDNVKKVTAAWTDQIVFLGDYFDDFDDNAVETEATALWLKESIQHSNRIHLMGNHDFHYMVKPAATLYCSGFAGWKHEIINSILTYEDWNKLEYFYSVNNTWFSHAGITRYWFEHPTIGTTEGHIRAEIAKSLISVTGDVQDIGCLWAADHYRGGRHKKGGLLWNDWRNTEFFEGITQVVGHTPRDHVISITKNGGTAINVDTHMKEVIIFDTDTKQYDIISDFDNLPF